MEQIPITPETLPRIIQKLFDASKSDKPQQVVITAYDGSLKARQRALARNWYETIANEIGLSVVEAESFCKLHYGLAIRCEDDPELEDLVNRMLAGRGEEDKLRIIAEKREWFPVLRTEGGMTTKQQSRYLADMQREMAQHGVYLTTPYEKDLLNCRDAQ